jgi:hypothetical protein
MSLQWTTEFTALFINVYLIMHGLLEPIHDKYVIGSQGHSKDQLKASKRWHWADAAIWGFLWLSLSLVSGLEAAVFAGLTRLTLFALVLNTFRYNTSFDHMGKNVIDATLVRLFTQAGWQVIRIAISVILISYAVSKLF